MWLFARIMLCVLFVGVTLYKYIDKMNELTELRLSIPLLEKEVQEIREKNVELSFQIESFESPLHLLELIRKPEFGHLKYPLQDDVIVLQRSKS